MMPEYLRALVVIIFLSSITYYLVNLGLVANFNRNQLKQWQKAWFIVLVGALVLKNIWLIAFAVFAVTNLTINSKSINRVYLYLVLLCTLPLFTAEIPGFAGIRYLFELTYNRLMIISLLIPLIFSQKNKQKLFSIKTDRYFIFFIVLLCAFQFRDNTLTNALRESLMIFITIFVPYYAITRIIVTHEQLRLALTALFIGIIPFAALGIFEILTNWLIYVPIIRILDDLTWNLYRDIRAGGIRASLLMGPITLGYTMIFAGALLLYLQHFIKNRKLVYIAFSVIFLCLLASKSRGPWIGFTIMLIMFLWTGRAGFSKLVKFGILGLGLLTIASLTPAGSKYMELLPFIGEERADTIDYRSDLIEQATILFKKNPLFGDVNFRETPEMESMRQGQGLIDVVNTYIGILLQYGLIALILFLAIFLSTVNNCRKIIKKPDISPDARLMGRVLIACIAGVMITIMTVSSVSYIPMFYWVLVALATAFVNIHRQQNERSQIHDYQKA